METPSTANAPGLVADEPKVSSAEDGVTDFAAIYEAHSRAVYYLALRLLGDATRAEDATHDVFLKAFRGFSRFRHDSEARTWLYRITINHCQNLRQSWHQRNIETTDHGLIEDRAEAHRETPLRVAEMRELGAQIQRT